MAAAQQFPNYDDEFSEFRFDTLTLTGFHTHTLPAAGTLSSFLKSFTSLTADGSDGGERKYFEMMVRAPANLCCASKPCPARQAPSDRGSAPVAL